VEEEDLNAGDGMSLLGAQRGTSSSHDGAADFDCGFVAGIVNTMKGLKKVLGSPK
jgi:hypothetical protein